MFMRVQPEKFYSAIALNMRGHTFRNCVHIYELNEYEQMRCFLNFYGTAGYAIKADGDIVSVFNNDHFVRSHSLIESAIMNGGVKLYCFGSILPALYKKAGFVEIMRLPFDDELSPFEWNDKGQYNKFNNSRPDVVFMALPTKRKN